MKQHGIFSFMLFVLLVGAVFFLEILKEKDQIKNIQSLLSAISEDARIQAIIIAFLFGSLIEGIAGFGRGCCRGGHRRRRKKGKARSNHASFMIALSESERTS